RPSHGLRSGATRMMADRGTRILPWKLPIFSPRVRRTTRFSSSTISSAIWVEDTRPETFTEAQRNLGQPLTLCWLLLLRAGYGPVGEGKWAASGVGSTRWDRLAIRTAHEPTSRT